MAPVPPTPRTLRPLRCRQCEPVRKFKTPRDLAEHILYKHGRVTLSPTPPAPQTEATQVSARAFVDDSPCATSLRSPKRPRLRTAHHAQHCLTVCTRQPFTALAAVPSAAPPLLDFAQGLF